MFEHTSNGTVFAVFATGALIFWLDSRTDRVGDARTGRRQFSLFGYDGDPAPAHEASSAPAQRPTQAPSVEATQPAANGQS